MRLVILAASILFTACTPAALARFRVEHDCSAATIRALGAWAFQVEGCGRVANYVCNPHRERGPGQAICVEERTWIHPTARRPPPSTDRLPGRMELQEGRVGSGPAVRLTIPQLGGVVITYAPEVDREHVVARIPATLATRCAGARIGAGSMLRVATRRGSERFEWPREPFAEVARGGAVSIAVCGRRLDVSGNDLAVLHAFADRAGALSRPEPDAADVVAEPDPTTPSADDATRAWIDASREVILGCASRETVIVRVEAGEGGATVSLQPPLAGGPEEACVRSALRDPPIVRGVVIHAVR